MRLRDQVGVVTGGGSGIGRAVAHAMAAEGAAIVVIDRDGPAGGAVADEIQTTGRPALAVEADVGSGAEVRRAMDAALGRFGKVDVLVNNAAHGEGDDVLEITEETWDRAVAVSLKGAFLCSRAVLPGMIDRRHGVILNIVSVNGMIALGQEAYSAAKAGLMSLTRSLAVRYGPFGIRANAIAPATVRTPAWDERLARDPAIYDRLARWYPLRRIGRPEDVGRAAVFLASEDASWITGVVLPVDGGLLAGNALLAEDLLGPGRFPPATSPAPGLPGPGGEV